MLTLIRFSLSYWKKIKEKNQKLTKTKTQTEMEKSWGKMTGEDATVKCAAAITVQPLRQSAQAALHSYDSVLQEKLDWLLRHRASGREHSFIWIALELGDRAHSLGKMHPLHGVMWPLQGAKAYQIHFPVHESKKKAAGTPVSEIYHFHHLDTKYHLLKEV